MCPMDTSGHHVWLCRAHVFRGVKVPQVPDGVSVGSCNMSPGPRDVLACKICAGEFSGQESAKLRRRDKSHCSNLFPSESLI